MEQVKINFTGDDPEEAKEAFFDWWKEMDIETCFKHYCKRASWDVEVICSEINDNEITVRTE